MFQACRFPSRVDLWTVRPSPSPPTNPGGYSWGLSALHCCSACQTQEQGQAKGGCDGKLRDSGGAKPSGPRLGQWPGESIEMQTAPRAAVEVWTQRVRMQQVSTSWPVLRARASVVPTSQGPLGLPGVCLVCETKGKRPRRGGHPDSLRCMRRHRCSFRRSPGPFQLTQHHRQSPEVAP